MSNSGDKPPPVKTQTSYQNGRYSNPWPSYEGLPNLGSFLKWQFRTKREEEKEVTDFEKELLKKNPAFKENPTEGLIATWLGHATVLIQMHGHAFLTDPVFSDRCSPVWHMGPKRWCQPPCTIDELPNIDAVVISHNHYDHLDKNTVQQLNKRFGEKLKWFVPAGVKAWFAGLGIHNNVEEKYWWDETSFKDDISIIALPCQHWSMRKGYDKMATLWCSWAIKGPKESFYFAGDTGYCKEFETIGYYYGPFTLAAIPIGCYKPRDIMKNQHIDPAEAVKIHVDVGAKNSLAVHWGTYDMGSNEAVFAPKRDLIEEVKKAGLNATDFFTTRHGESWNSVDQTLS